MDRIRARPGPAGGSGDPRGSRRQRSASCPARRSAAWPTAPAGRSRTRSASSAPSSRSTFASGQEDACPCPWQQRIRVIPRAKETADVHLGSRYGGSNLSGTGPGPRWRATTIRPRSQNKNKPTTAEARHRRTALQSFPRIQNTGAGGAVMTSLSSVESHCVRQRLQEHWRCLSRTADECAAKFRRRHRPRHARARAVTAIKDGTFVIFWGANPNLASPELRNTVLAYVKDVPEKGGVVAHARWHVVPNMTAQRIQDDTPRRASNRRFCASLSPEAAAGRSFAQREPAWPRFTSTTSRWTSAPRS